MPTSAWIIAKDNSNSEPKWLLEIELDPDNILYLSDEYWDDGTNYYEGLVRSFDSVYRSIDFNTGMGRIQDCQITLFNQRLQKQDDITARLLDLLCSEDTNFGNKEARIYLNFAGLTLADKELIFRGEITAITNITSSSFTLQLEQQEFNIMVPPTSIEKAVFTAAPDQTIGMKVPIVYGKYSESSWDDYTPIYLQKASYTPIVMADEGEKKFIIADHTIYTWGVPAVWISQCNEYAVLHPATNGGTGVYDVNPNEKYPATATGKYRSTLWMEQDYVQVKLYHYPQLVSQSRNTAHNPKNPMIRDLDTYAVVNATYPLLSLRFTGPEAIGDWVSGRSKVYIQSHLSQNTGSVDIRWRDTAGPTLGPNHNISTTGWLPGSPIDVTSDAGQRWDEFPYKEIELEVAYNSGEAYIDVIFLIIIFDIYQEILHTSYPPLIPGTPYWQLYYQDPAQYLSLAKTSLQVRGNMPSLGIECDGMEFGTWIGSRNGFSAGDLIEESCYIIESFLRDWLNRSNSLIDTTTIDAEYTANNDKSVALAGVLTEEINSGPVLSGICLQSRQPLFIGGDGKFKMATRQSDSSGLSADHTIYWDDILEEDLNVEHIPYSNIQLNIYVNYHYNLATQKYDHLTFIRATKINPSVTATSAINSTSTTLFVSTLDPFIVGDLILLNHEICSVSGINTLSSSLTITRGQKNTTATSHIYGTSIFIIRSMSDDGEGTRDESGTGEREDQAMEVLARYGIENRLEINADWIREKTVANTIRNFYFDYYSRPHTEVTFKTNLNFADVELMDLLEFDNATVGEHIKPVLHSSWTGLIFEVTSKRMIPPGQIEFKAVSVD